MPLIADGPTDLVSLLIVEDEPRYLDSTRQLLAPHLGRIDTAMNGVQALAWLSRHHYDLVLLDLHLPDTTGHALMAHLREQQPASRVIVMSGDSRIESAIHSIRLGSYDYLRKPCEPEELIKTVRNAAHKVVLEQANQLMREQIEQSEEWHRLLVNTSPDVIYTLDRDSRFTFLNESIGRILGYLPQELVGKSYEVLVPELELERARYRLNERRNGNRATRNLELRLKRKESPLTPNHEATVTVEISATGMYRPQPDGSGEFLGTHGVARDISARKQAEATITFQAHHDLLTGLPNRSLFNDRVTQAIAQARRHGQSLAIMFLDMDRFKLVNDTLGHLVGDGLLQGMSQRLRDCLREGDTLARIGGDEFMLLLPLVRSRDNAAFIAQKILASLKHPFHIDGHEIYSGMSIGISVFPEDGDNLETLSKHADLAMYHAKDHGRNDFRFFTHELHRTLSGRLAVENDMRRGIQRGEFEMYYQPQVDIQSQRISGMEALIRWHHPERGLVAPGDFIPIAEECGLITPISKWVLDVACKQAKVWRAAGMAPISMGVNLSTREIEHPHFVDNFIKSLNNHGIDGKGIEIEITESTLMRDMDGAIEKLRRLAELGVKISIDDFGTGYSSLSYLKKLPVHTLKIDRSFIQDLVASSNGGTIVAGITAMAKGLKLNVVAEGVETHTQLDYLESIGCDAYQGYLFSQPVAVDNATKLLRAS